MAQKQSAEDAVSAAMMAIEDALSLPPKRAAPPPRRRRAPAPRPRSRRPRRPRRRRRRRWSSPSCLRRWRVGRRKPKRRPRRWTDHAAANDDRAALGPIVQALQSRRPSRAPFATAIAGSLVWFALCVAYAASLFFAATPRLPATDFLTRPETVLIGLAALGPALLLFGFVALSRRVQELRLSAGSITQVALRLAEPESAAGEQIATLAQAVRREISSMGDGVERALARAAELETLVRSEVSTIERAYSDNERRMRSLIAEMADQRAALAAQADQVRLTVDGTHQGVAADLESLAERLSERVSTLGERVAASLGAASEDVAITIDRAGAGVVDRISNQGAQIRKSLAEVGDDVASRLAESNQAFAADFAKRGDDVASRLAESNQLFAADFAKRGDDLVERLDASGRQVSEAIFRAPRSSRRGSTRPTNACTTRSSCADRRWKTRWC